MLNKMIAVIPSDGIFVEYFTYPFTQATSLSKRTLFATTAWENNKVVTFPVDNYVIFHICHHFG